MPCSQLTGYYATAKAKLSRSLLMTTVTVLSHFPANCGDKEQYSTDNNTIMLAVLTTFIRSGEPGAAVRVAATSSSYQMRVKICNGRARRALRG